MLARVVVRGAHQISSQSLSGSPLCCPLRLTSDHRQSEFGRHGSADRVATGEDHRRHATVFWTCHEITMLQDDTCPGHVIL